MRRATATRSRSRWPGERICEGRTWIPLGGLKAVNRRRNLSQAASGVKECGCYPAPCEASPERSEGAAFKSSPSASARDDEWMSVPQHALLIEIRKCPGRVVFRLEGVVSLAA